jgi:hypothetical protein
MCFKGFIVKQIIYLPLRSHSCIFHILREGLVLRKDDTEKKKLLSKDLAHELFFGDQPWL